MFLLLFQTHVPMFLSLQSLSRRREGNSPKISDKICILGFFACGINFTFYKTYSHVYLADSFVNIFICLNLLIFLTEVTCKSVLVNVIYSHSPCKTVGLICFLF